MLKHRLLCAFTMLLCLAPRAFADAASHAAEAEKFLKLTSAEQIARPYYAQVEQMFAMRFAELQAPAEKRAVLDTYIGRADGLLDQAVGWNKIKPELVGLYVSNFTEAELKELITFYQSPVGSKMMKTMPKVYSDSMLLTQEKLEPLVPQLEQLLEQMSKELAQKKP
jgi:hypothetical protein